MSTWWHYRGGQTTKPYVIAVGLAEEIHAAVDLFGETFPCAFVRELTSPKLLELPEVAALKPGEIAMIYVDQLPSAYDRFVLPDGRIDYDMMEREGYDRR